MEMNDKELSELSAVDWKKIKDFISGVVAELENISNKLPAGNVKNLVSIIVALLNMICMLIPG